MMPNWNISRWLYQVIPFMLRKPKLIAWVNCLLTPVSSLLSDLLEFRDKTFARMQPNAQTMSLEYHLNNLFDPSLRRIYIRSASEVLDNVYIYNAAEAEEDPFIYNAAESVPNEVYLYSQAEYFTGNFFIVYVPLSANDPRIPAIVENYKLGGTTFTIKTT